MSKKIQKNTRSDIKIQNIGSFDRIESIESIKSIESIERIEHWKYWTLKVLKVLKVLYNVTSKFISLQLNKSTNQPTS